MQKINSFLSAVVFLVLLVGLAVLPGYLVASQAESDPAGQVVAVRGQVTAAGHDGEIRQLRQGDPLFPGDIVSTGPNSQVRLQFSDNGIIALRPSSRFVIDEYHHADDPELDRSAFSLVRGGFRAVSGSISRDNPDNHRIDTPAATIGIRGTEHYGRYCDADCFDLVDIGIDAPPDGLYTGTLSGQTVVGGQSFQAGEFGYTDPLGQTVVLPEPPAILVGDPDLQEGLLPDPDALPGEDSPPEAPDGDPAEMPLDEQPGADEGVVDEGPADTSTADPDPATVDPADSPDQDLTEDADYFDIPERPAEIREIDC